MFLLGQKLELFGQLEPREMVRGKSLAVLVVLMLLSVGHGVGIAYDYGFPPKPEEKPKEDQLTGPWARVRVMQPMGRYSTDGQFRYTFSGNVVNDRENHAGRWMLEVVFLGEAEEVLRRYVFLNGLRFRLPEEIPFEQGIRTLSSDDWNRVLEGGRLLRKRPYRVEIVEDQLLNVESFKFISHQYAGWPEG